MSPVEGSWGSISASMKKEDTNRGGSRTILARSSRAPRLMSTVAAKVLTVVSLSAMNEYSTCRMGKPGATPERELRMDSNPCSMKSKLAKVHKTRGHNKSDSKSLAASAEQFLPVLGKTW